MKNGSVRNVPEMNINCSPETRDTHAYKQPQLDTSS